MSLAFLPESMNYKNIQEIINKAFICGYCGKNVASNKGYGIHKHTDGSGDQIGGIYICPNCKGPTLISTKGSQHPGAIIGNSIKNVPDDIYSLYEESRQCFSCHAYTAVVLLCRKMLMNISVKLGATEGQKFIKYVEFLHEKNYIPPNAKEWVDHIRKIGNEANHEIKLTTHNDANELILFMEVLLKIVFELPSIISK